MRRQMEYNEATEAMVEQRARGKTFAQISVKMGIPAEECAARVHDYLTSAYSATSIVEMRMLQLRRFEMVIDALWDQVRQGDLVLEGKGATNLLNTMNHITELMDLKKDRLRDEQVQLTRAHTQLIMGTLDSVRLQMLDVVINMVRDHGDDPRVLENRLAGTWDGVFADVTDKAMEENESMTIQMGPGAKEIG